MRFLKNLILGLLLVVAVLVGISFFLPGETQVARSVTVNAPPEKVFPLVNDLKEFNKWSPWAKRDSTIKVTYDGPDSGVGQKMTWTSENVGSGTQTITAAEDNKSVSTSLSFEGQGNANAAWTLKPEGDGTEVTWSFSTTHGFNPISRWMGLMFDKWIGQDYEEGLANLKAMAEAG